ncbi:MAG: PIN domain-containing protein [Chloroflexota bacterium]
MIVEAQKSLRLDSADLASYLKNHPQIVRQLKYNLRIPSLLSDLNVDIRPLTHVHHHVAKRFRQQYGVMSNDSLILGFMATEKIQSLATNDRDFRRVREIVVWEP